ncbi:MAG: hypothetical protein IJ789_02840 [Bacteroidales bacterium]|nr:hypothetical protein [Bacteroidales bacterium]
MKRTSLITILILLFTSCIRDLEQEGIYSEMTVRGTVVEQTSQQSVEGMRVRLIYKEQTIASTLSLSDGTFEMPLSLDKLSKGVSVQAYADSLYDGVSLALEPHGYGQQYYDVGTLYVAGPELPTVVTGEVVDVRATSAQGVGEVLSSGKSTVVRRGLCWSTLQYPTLANAYVVGGSGEGLFSVSMENLAVGTTYYVRAFATNGVGTAYGEQQVFSTLAGLPSVQTATEATLLSVSTAQCGGVVVDDGGFAITARGVCWSTTPEPTVSNLHSNDGNGMGTFVSTLTGLLPSATYYVRAYATNANGTVYGEQLIFTTQSGLPTVSTATATSITATSAVCGGEVETDGGYSVTRRGVCYSTSPQPTMAGLHTTDGAGTGQFVSHLLNLTPNTQYYLRAYATNATGTVYGEERVFITTN